MIPADIIKKVRQIQIRTRHMVSDVFAGHYHSVFKGQGMEFDEVREYIPGDDVRSIDWNVTARTGHPFIKKFVEERELTMMLCVDVSRSNYFGSSEQLKKDLSAELTALLAFSAIQNSDRVGLILYSDRVERYIPPQKGLKHVLRVIREVLYFEPEGHGTRLSPTLDFLNQILKRKAVVFCISDFYTEDEFSTALKITAKRHDCIAVITGDKRECSIPKAGLVEWQDAETGERLLIDTSHRAARTYLEEQELQRRTDLNRKLRQMGVDSLEVFAGESYDKEFIRFFKMRERRMRYA